MLSSYRRLLQSPLRLMTRDHWDLTVSLPEPRWGRLRGLIGLFNLLFTKLQAIVLQIAGAAVSLGRVAPELSAMAQNLQSGAREQARRAGDIAQAGHELELSVHAISESTQEAAAFSSQVAQATRTLHQRSSDIGEIMGIIRRVANQTRLLSLNASVEAARAGEHGLGFAVVASEIKTLADQTMTAAQRVEDILSTIQGQVAELVTAVGGDNAASRDQGRNLHALIARIAAAGQEQERRVEKVAQDIASVAETAQAHHQSAEQLAGLGDQVRDHCADLLTHLGFFRLPAHAKARQVVEAAAAAPEFLGLERGRMEAFMRQVAGRHSFFELLYVTDAQGRQVTDNISNGRFQASYGSTGFGQNWAGRPWFQGAMEAQDTYISGLYRSVATDNFCFTIATPLWDAQDRLVGVLGADVHFGDLIAA
ncbi:MAG: methyl-accepting chemotaxis protein [Pseudomonadota bacterium]